MVRSIKRKSKLKRFPYIEVEGIKNQYLDGALLKTCGPSALEQSLSDEFKIIKKAGITVQNLKKNTYSPQELIEKVSPYLLESYDFYNFLANQWDEILHNTLDKHFSDVDYTKFTLDDWEVEIRELYMSEMPVYAVVNFLRFYKKGELKELIPQYFAEDDFIIDFYDETGIKVEEMDIDWDSIENDSPFNDELLAGLNEEDITPKFFERNPQDALMVAAKLISGVSERISDLGVTEEYRELYEAEKNKIEKLQAKVEELGLKVKSKDATNQSLSKENRTLSQNVDALNSKLEQAQKENGRLGGIVGEIRKEKESLEKANNILEKRLATLEKEAGFIAEKIKKVLEAEQHSKILKMQMQFDETTSDLNKQIRELKRLLEEEQAKTSVLSSDLVEKDQQLKIVKNDLQVVEKERNELVEQLKKPPQRDLSEIDDEMLFGFDEEDLEEFVEFDNKPTRN